MRAILYSRWSSLDQTGTTSASRQRDATESFANRQGWTVVERISDEGQSAWTGANITTGQLAALVARLEPNGGHDHVLVVEKLDRLSRQPPLVMAAWVQRACATGLTIATADGAILVDRERLARDQMTVITMIFEAFRGFSESQAKSERVSDAWARKRAKRAPMTRRCPAWLTIAVEATAFKSAANGQVGYQVIEDRAAIVRRIFDMTARGIGKATIATTLNREGVAVWGRGRGWHSTYVTKILRNPAVIGEFQPHTKPKGGTRAPAGEPIANYFPAVVPVALYEKVNERRAARVRQQQSPNRLVNLFGGLAHCARCGGSMTHLDKGRGKLASGARTQWRYLRCSNNHRSLGCDNGISYPYAVVEDAVLDKLLHLAMDDQSFASGDEAQECEERLAEAQRRLAKAAKQRDFAYNILEEDSEDELAAERYRQRKNDAKEAKADVQRLTDELADLRGAASPEEHVARIAEVRSLLGHDDDDLRYDARSRVKIALNDLVADIVFEARKKRFSIRLVDGIRCLSFDIGGNCGSDVDWTDLPNRKAITPSPVIADYLRRKGATAIAG